MKPQSVLILLFFALLLSGCSLSLAGDVLPPPELSGATVEPAADLPASLPDPQQGQDIYIEKCAPCHGESGRGDGELASRAASPVPDIQSRAVWLNASPAAWYRLVTEGNMAKGMPPFASLNDQQRWNVVAYALSLGMDAADMRAGSGLFSQDCANCHGPNGRGGPAEGGAVMPDWTSPSALAGLTGQQLLDAISAGLPPAMPAYAGQYTTQQIWQLAAYTRALAFSGGPQQLITSTAALPVENNNSNPQPGSFDIRGQIVLPDGAQPGAALPVTLRGYDQMQETFQSAGSAKADGSFVFEDVKAVSGRIYLVTVDYEGLTYNSEFLAADEVAPLQEVELQIAVYPASSDPALLTADRLHVILDLSSPQLLQVGEILVFSNRSNRVVLPVQDGEPTLRISLPEEATDLAFEENGDTGNLTPFDGGFAYLAPVEPGSTRQVLFGYSLPFTGRSELRLVLPMDTEELVVMVTGGQASLSSDQLTFSGTRSIQGTQVQIYSGRGLTAGQPLSLTITRSTPLTIFWIGGVVFLVCAAAAGLILSRRKRGRATLSPNAAESESLRLMDAVIALDDQRRAGEISENAYQKRRKELLAALEATLRSGNGNSRPG